MSEIDSVDPTDNALRESEERYRFLTENIPVQIWTARSDGFLDYVSQRTAHHLGVTPEKLLREGWQSVVHPEDLPGAVERWMQSIQSGTVYEVEFRLKVRSGEYAWHLARAVPQRDASGSVVRWFGTNTDIQEQRDQRRRMEDLLHAVEENAAELQRARDRVLEILDSTQDSFFALDSSLRIVLVNRNQEKTSQVVRDDSVGRPFFEVFPVPPDSKYWTEYHRVIEERVAVHFEDFYAPLQLWTEVSATPTPEGGAAVFYRDITGRKALEAEREALLTSERKTRLDAEVARSQAESANRMKDEFLSTVSHELRTPLNAILGWAAMLKGGSLDAAKQTTAVDTIERNARAQVRLIEDLLDLGRILQGKFQLAVGPVEVVRVVEAALDSIRPGADAKGIRLQRTLDSHATIVGDGERIQQIAWNLVSNAIKFTPKGGRVHVTLRRAPSFVELVVADNGVGISAEFLPHIFEPFRQADGAITRRSGGLGLGLSIVRSLVELHGGSVSAASDGQGKGSTFMVRLPMAPIRSISAEQSMAAATPGEPASPSFESPPALARRRVLVVDDEQDTRNLIAYVLQQCGAFVTMAESGAEAVARLTKEAFDVIISDVGMPEEDGLSLIRRIRRLPDAHGGRIPAVALTAYARSEDRAQALRAGFNMHLTKPVDPSELALAVAAVLGNPRGEQ